MSAVTITAHETTDALADVLGAVFDIVCEFSEVYAIPVRRVTMIEGFNPRSVAMIDEPTLVYIEAGVGTTLLFAP